jgi:hypothetical protein
LPVAPGDVRLNAEYTFGIARREKSLMAQATVGPPTIKTMADLQTRLGGIPLDRIWFRPAPGTAAERDVIEAEARENRLCELVDGTLVEKAVGFEESRLAGELMYLVKAYLRQNDLGIAVGEAGMMRIAPGLVESPTFRSSTGTSFPAGRAPPIRSLIWRPTWPSKCSSRGTPRRR